jgi:hypothetical protein
MGHVVLLGDSIFDNARYVPRGPSVIEHLRRCLPNEWRATLLARDGAVTADISVQIRAMPADASHLVVSTGGNDALAQGGLLLQESARSVRDALYRLADTRALFSRNYRGMLELVLGLGIPTAVCTVYDAIPGLDRGECAGLCVFNDVILREAFRAGVPVIDLRLTCADVRDYAETSPIEPSVQGGWRVAGAVVRVVTAHDFGSGSSRVYH